MSSPKDEEWARKASIAKEMLRMPEPLRDAAIEAADNVIDARPQFLHRQKQNALAQEYKRAFSRRPGGGAA